MTFSTVVETDEDTETDLPSLTLCEAEVVEYVMDGLTYRQIALNLGIEVTTIKFHLAKSREKFGAVNNSHLIAMICGRRKPQPEDTDWGKDMTQEIVTSQ